MDKEHALFSAKEFRAVVDSKEAVIEGHAAVFNQYADIGGCFYEVISEGAFDSADLTDVALFVNHDTQRIPLARSKANDANGTMTVKVDSIGLAIRAKLDTENNQSARELYSAIARGDLNKMSFAFTVDAEEWQDLKSDMPTRIIKRIKKVYEVSCVVYPAYNATDVGIADRAQKKLETARRKAVADEAEIERLKKENKVIFGMINTHTEERTNLEMKGEILKDRINPREIMSPLNIFGELRATKIDTPDILVPTHSGTTVNPAFPVVSSLIDSVTKLNLNDGDNFLMPYSRGFTNTAFYSDEEAEAALTEHSFGFAELHRCKIDCYSELSGEILKLAAANYAAIVFQNVSTALRKAIAKEILFGKGVDDSGDNFRITGIFSPRATAIDPATDFEVAQITDVLLDDILMRYGGDCDVDQAATLILSKQDLIAFSRVRSSVKSRINEIIYTSGNTGTISGVPFIISPDIPAITDPATKSGDYCMCYGNPRNYTICEFSPVEIEMSRDYRFRQGMVCYRGTAFVGGNVTAENGFVRIKKV